MTPSQSIVAATSVTIMAADRRGRSIKVRRLNALDSLRLYKAAGAILANNQAWLSMAALAYAAVEIDGVPMPIATTEALIEAAVERLGDDGIEAIAEALDRDAVALGDTTEAVAGNSHGTPI